MEERSQYDGIDFYPFKKDIDALMQEFAEGKFEMLADMKRIWLSRKFSYIFDALPSRNLPEFIQSMFTHCLSYMSAACSLSHRLGSLYCLYFLYETQPFNPPFKIYLTLGELRSLKTLVIDAKEKKIKVVTAVVKRMLERNAFLFGSFGIKDRSRTERVKEVIDFHNARVQKMSEMLFSNSKIEDCLHMDMGAEFDQEELKKISKAYANAKDLAIKGASGRILDVDNIKHIAEYRETLADALETMTKEWNEDKAAFFSKTRGVQQSELLRLPAPGQHQVDDLRNSDGLLLLTAGEGEQTPDQHQDNDDLHSADGMLLLTAAREDEKTSSMEDGESEDLRYAEELAKQLGDEESCEL